jgi:uncharacterized lipoprotein YajG
MRILLFLLSFLFGFSAIGQELQIVDVKNSIVIGELAGNRDLSFGVKNVLEEVVQDYGYDLNPTSNNLLEVELLYFDVQKNNMQLAVYAKNIDVYQIIARGVYTDGKKKRKAVAKWTAKSISTATLVIDQGGKFSQANVSTAIKKLCEDLIKKLKL